MIYYYCYDLRFAAERPPLSEPLAPRHQRGAMQTT
jgi:hypothetical protein